jgi:hypothetical protein
LYCTGKEGSVKKSITSAGNVIAIPAGVGVTLKTKKPVKRFRIVLAIRFVENKKINMFVTKHILLKQRSELNYRCSSFLFKIYRMGNPE